MVLDPYVSLKPQFDRQRESVKLKPVRKPQAVHRRAWKPHLSALDEFVFTEVVDPITAHLFMLDTSFNDLKFLAWEITGETQSFARLPKGHPGLPLVQAVELMESFFQLVLMELDHSSSSMLDSVFVRKGNLRERYEATASGAASGMKALPMIEAENRCLLEEARVTFEALAEGLETVTPAHLALQEHLEHHVIVSTRFGPLTSFELIEQLYRPLLDLRNAFFHEPEPGMLNQYLELVAELEADGDYQAVLASAEVERRGTAKAAVAVIDHARSRLPIQSNELEVLGLLELL